MHMCCAFISGGKGRFDAAGQKHVTGDRDQWSLRLVVRETAHCIFQTGPEGFEAVTMRRVWSAPAVTDETQSAEAEGKESPRLHCWWRELSSQHHRQHPLTDTQPVS